jgi:Photosynthetic reaction centre cytochrome C subunit
MTPMRTLFPTVAALLQLGTLSMVREINARFPDGKQHVTCFTCHRGSIVPATEP